jgi:lipoate-protein ligase B
MMSGGGRQRVVQILRGNSSSRGVLTAGSFSAGAPIDYPVGWAWQTLLLHQRLQSKRRREEEEGQKPKTTAAHHHDDDDADQLIVLEHNAPVYTLGRGADIRHLTGLLNRPAQQNQNHHHNGDDDPSWLVQQQRHCLTGRGVGTARLEAPSRPVLDELLLSVDLHHHHPNQHNTLATLRPAIDALLQQGGTVPVYSQLLDNDTNIPIYRVERGGEVTYHGPGQLVIYPLLDLSVTPPYRRDLHWFLRELEQLIIDTIMYDFGVGGNQGVVVHRDEKYTGVWISDTTTTTAAAANHDGRGGGNNARKIAAIGLTASRWITSHGFSLNVHPNLRHFDHIRPCGIDAVEDLADHGDNNDGTGLQQQRRGVTSLYEELGRANCPTMRDVTECLLHNFAKRFNVQLVEDNNNNGD